MQARQNQRLEMKRGEISERVCAYATLPRNASDFREIYLLLVDYHDGIGACGGGDVLQITDNDPGTWDNNHFTV